MANLTITLPDGSLLVPKGATIAGTPFALNPDDGADVAVYTRALGLTSLERPSHRTAAATGRVEYAVVDTRVVSRKTGGQLDIPQNGLVLSFAPKALPSGVIPDEALSRVRYGFAREAHRGIRQAVQAGPMLLKGGRRVITSSSLADEQFWPTPPGNTDVSDIGLVPTDYPDDVDQRRAGRMGIGVDAEDHVIAVAVPGTERRPPQGRRQRRSNPGGTGRSAGRGRGCRRHKSGWWWFHAVVLHGWTGNGTRKSLWDTRRAL